MVAGHLQEKNNLYYVVLNYADTQGKRKSKWISTGLPVKGNKKRAETRLLMKEREKFNPAPQNRPERHPVRGLHGTVAGYY